ncbi:MAG: histidine phosphatase family protein [Acidimicrobiia bacterium]|nr:histidine phosphatase family protein [Acidimicrobiia bacterium]MDH5235988.1 histidine phosphatase family protein [Acidimicrobiia bacterium]
MLRLLLVRHAQSEWNASGRWQGQADPPLSDLGVRQAALAARAVGAVDGIVASPLERAVHTASIIAEEVGVGPVLTADHLIERDAGEWSGLTRADIDEQWPGYLQAGHRPPGYEDDTRLLERVLTGLGGLADHFGTPAEVLVVAHAGVIYAVESHLGEPFERIPNLGGRWVTYDGSHLQLGLRVELLDAEHATVQAPDQL